MRALLMGLLVATPSLLLGSLASGPIEIAVLLSLIAATVTFLEYKTAYPSFVEFRDAPPINRIRFVALFAMVFLVSIACKHAIAPNNLTSLITGVANLVGKVTDFPYSPVRMVLLMLPENTSGNTVFVVRLAAGTTYVISLLSIAVFYLTVKVGNWPVANGSFNVWVNLPMFDPTVGRDVVARLQRDARINISLGVLLPFLIPAVLLLLSRFGMQMDIGNPHVLIWMIAAWGFVPTSLIFRGIALQRIADLIEQKRRRAYADAQEMQTA